MSPSFDLTPVVEHLDRQLASVGQMLAALEEQERAVRAQDVPAVMQATTALQAEIVRRDRLEADREDLLAAAAIWIGCAPDAVTASGLAGLDPEGLGPEVARKSNELRERVRVVQTRYTAVQEMLRSELAFVAHLVAAMNPASSARAESYHRPGQAPVTPRRPSSLDVRG